MPTIYGKPCCSVGSFDVPALEYFAFAFSVMRTKNQSRKFSNNEALLGLTPSESLHVHLASCVPCWERAGWCCWLHLGAPPSEATCTATNLRKTDDWWMASDRRRICSALNYSAPPHPPRSISTSLGELWGPLASPLSAASSCSASAELSVTPARRCDGWRRAQGPSCSAAESQIEAFCRSTGVPGSPALLSAQILTDPLGPADNLPSHLAFIQTPPSNQRAAAAFAGLSLTGFQYEKVIWQRGLFWINHLARLHPAQTPFYFFSAFILFLFFLLCLDSRAMKWAVTQFKINRWAN